jgi:hypothetical protein
MARIHTQPDLRDREHSANLFRRFHECPRLVVEHRLVATRAATADHDGHSPRELRPLFFGVSAGRVARTRARVVTAEVGAIADAEVRQSRAWVGAEPERLDRVEDVEHRVQLGKGLLEHFRVRVRQFEVRTGETQPPLGELGAEILGAAQITDGAEINARIAGLADLVEDIVAVRNVRVESDRHLEGAIADGCVGDDDSAVAAHVSYSF